MLAATDFIDRPHGLPAPLFSVVPAFGQRLVRAIASVIPGTPSS